MVVVGQSRIMSIVLHLESEISVSANTEQGLDRIAKHRVEAKPFQIVMDVDRCRMLHGIHYPLIMGFFVSNWAAKK
ncbi:hypothetical protein V6N13_143370 [Hibiscus sabdariffa]|uniref:Uncharacterized protein n=1 Tax=Hibiscus sabdariffa TaxID=183260 RepID=A0ABR2FH86_9ROSI